MQQLDEAAYSEFATLLSALVATYSPEWTDSNESDPGVQLMELFAFLTESRFSTAQMRYPSAGGTARIVWQSSRKRSPIAMRASRIACLSDLATFPVRSLVSKISNFEQDYFRRRLRRLNRELHGPGVVRGLEVSVQSGSPSAERRVVVMPGFALMPHGEEVELCELQTISNPPEEGHLSYVVLLHVEVSSHPVPTANGGSTHLTRVEEGFAIRFEAAALDAGVTLARLVRKDSGSAYRQRFQAAAGS